MCSREKGTEGETPKIRRTSLSFVEQNTENGPCLLYRWQSPEGCRFGDRCNFAHGDQELRKLPSRKAAPPPPQQRYSF